MTIDRPLYYVLDEAGEPHPESDLDRWSHNIANRRAAFGVSIGDRERDPWRVAISKVGEWELSTVFLGIDHRWSGNGPPVLWETMIFGPEPWSEYQERYSSRAAAEAGHARMVDLLIQGDSPLD